MMYFDNAATTYPKPPQVARAVSSAVTRFGGNPGRSGHAMSLRAAQMVYECREKTAELFGCDGTERVIFLKNCTEATNFAIKGYVPEHCHVIISDLEHNAVSRPVYALSQRAEVSCSVAHVVEGEPEQTVRNFEREIRSGYTKAIITTHASNVFGVIVPVERLYALCESYGLYLIIDAAQTAGVLPIDLKKMPNACLCAAGHKSLYGPTGTGILVAAPGELPQTVIEGGTGSFSEDLTQPDLLPDRLESGTVNTVGICGLSAGIDFVRKTGVSRIEAHERKLARFLHRQLGKNPNVELYTDCPQEGVHVPVISFNIKGMHSEEVASALNRMGAAVRAGLHCAPLAHRAFSTLDTGTVRASFFVFNTLQETERFAWMVEKIAGKRT